MTLDLLWELIEAATTLWYGRISVKFYFTEKFVEVDTLWHMS